MALRYRSGRAKSFLSLNAQCPCRTRRLCHCSVWADPIRSAAHRFAVDVGLRKHCVAAGTPAQSWPPFARRLSLA